MSVLTENCFLRFIALIEILVHDIFNERLFEGVNRIIDDTQRWLCVGPGFQQHIATLAYLFQHGWFPVSNTAPADIGAQYNSADGTPAFGTDNRSVTQHLDVSHHFPAALRATGYSRAPKTDVETKHIDSPLCLSGGILMPEGASCVPH